MGRSILHKAGANSLAVVRLHVTVGVYKDRAPILFFEWCWKVTKTKSIISKENSKLWRAELKNNKGIERIKNNH